MVIPKCIYQSWKSKELPVLLQKNIDRIKELNPGYEHKYYDDEDCRQFILKHYGLSYLRAFDSLVHGAFKCDFWRYCVLYKQGGIYVDIDMLPLVPFNKIIQEDDEFVSIIDGYRPSPSISYGIYQSFLACSPGHPALLHAITISYVNIINQKVPDETFILDITGPLVMGRALNIFWQNPMCTKKIKPGRYKDSHVVLYPSHENSNKTKNFEGENIFINKTSGYDKISKENGYYSRAKNYYKPSQSNETANKTYFFWCYLLTYLILLFIILTLSVSILAKVLLAVSFLIIFGIASVIQYFYTEELVNNVHVFLETDECLDKEKEKIIRKKIYFRYYGAVLNIWTPKLMKDYGYKNKEDVLDNHSGKIYDLTKNDFVY